MKQISHKYDLVHEGYTQTSFGDTAAFFGILFE